MQTIYYNTNNFISHTSNVVSLEDYRHKLTLAQEGSLAPQPAQEPLEMTPPIREIWPQADAQQVRPRRHVQRQQRALFLDLLASASVLVMTVTFTVQILL